MNAGMMIPRTSLKHFALAVFLAARPLAVRSCGGFMCTLNQPVVQAAESIAFGLKGRTVEMHVQIRYEGPSEDFSWILPTPFQPDISVGSDVLFLSLFDRTRPVFELNIDFESGSNLPCMEDDEILCAEEGFADSAAAGGPPSATVLDEGTVGPFNYTIIEAEDGHPETVRRWLDDNGYDQPPGTAPLLNYYAEMGQKFVALRLTKGTDAGEIRPVVLKYDLPESMGDVLKMPFACVPIQLTSVAAADDMPIQVYLLADARGFPSNYFDVELDDALADWVGCLGSPNCYLNDMRARFEDAKSISNHSFVTEYAGLSNIMEEAIELKVDVSALGSSATPLDFLRRLDSAGVPALPIVHTLIENAIPKVFPASETFCDGQTNLYNPSFNSWIMNECVPKISPPATWSFDPEALASEINEKVLLPSENAQDWVDSHPYLTRLFAQLSPSQMNKDPFFAFNPDLPPVDRVHRASAKQVCVEDENGSSATALEIVVERGGGTRTEPASLGCSGWSRRSSDPLFGVPGTPSTASRVVGHGYQGEEGGGGVEVQRGADGTFPASDVEAAVAAMDDRVVDQTVPPYDGDGSTTATTDPPPGQKPSGPPVAFDPDVDPDKVGARSSAVRGAIANIPSALRLIVAATVFLC